MGPLTQTLNGNSYVGLAVCALTKYVEAAGKIALKNQNFFERVYTLVIQTYCNTPADSILHVRKKCNPYLTQ